MKPQASILSILLFISLHVSFTASQKVQERCFYHSKKEGCEFLDLSQGKKECWDCKNTTNFPGKNTIVTLGSLINPRPPQLLLYSNLEFQSLYLVNCKLNGDGFNITVSNEIGISRTSTLILERGKMTVLDNKAGKILNNGTLLADHLSARLLLNDQELTIGQWGIDKNTVIRNTVGSNIYLDQVNTGTNYPLDGLIENHGSLKIAQFAPNEPKITTVFSPLNTGKIVNYPWSNWRIEPLEENSNYSRVSFLLPVLMNQTTLYVRQTKGFEAYSPLVFYQLTSFNSKYDCFPPLDVQEGTFNSVNDTISDFSSNSSRIFFSGNVSVGNLTTINSTINLTKNSLMNVNKLDSEDSKFSGGVDSRWTTVESYFRRGEWRDNINIQCSSQWIGRCTIADVEIAGGNSTIVGKFTWSGDLKGKGTLISPNSSSLFSSGRSVWNIDRVLVSNLILDFKNLSQDTSFLNFGSDSQLIDIKNISIHFEQIDLNLKWGRNYALVTSSSAPIHLLNKIKVIGRHSDCLFPNISFTPDNKSIFVNYAQPSLPTILSSRFEMNTVVWVISPQDCIDIQYLEIYVGEESWRVKVKENVASWDASNITHSDLCSINKVDIRIVGTMSNDERPIVGPLTSYYIQTTKVRDFKPTLKINSTISSEGFLLFQWSSEEMTKKNSVCEDFPTNITFTCVFINGTIVSYSTGIWQDGFTLPSAMVPCQLTAWKARLVYKLGDQDQNSEYSTWMERKMYYPVSIPAPPEITEIDFGPRRRVPTVKFTFDRSVDWCSRCPNSGRGIQVTDDYGNKTENFNQNSFLVKTVGYSKHSFSYRALCSREDFETKFESEVRHVDKELWQNGDPVNVRWILIAVGVAVGIVLFSAALAGFLLLVNRCRQEQNASKDDEIGLMEE